LVTVLDALIGLTLLAIGALVLKMIFYYCSAGFADRHKLAHLLESAVTEEQLAKIIGRCDSQPSDAEIRGAGP